MGYFYQVFGLNCFSEIEIPAFLPLSFLQDNEIDFHIKIGKAKSLFTSPPRIFDDFSQMNEDEYYLHVPDVAGYFVRNGREVIIEPISEHMQDILLYFKSNCMAAILYQKNLLPFHVSGVISPDGGVWLFSAPSGTGKSTTALKLQERGYRLFTDDTALIYVENGICFARASYPMLKAWQETLENQKSYRISDSFPLNQSHKKFGLLFHKEFVNRPAVVKGIIFLEKEGSEIQIQPVSQVQGLGKLMENVYRGEWVSVLKKNQLQFNLVTSIAKTIPFWIAKRPEGQATFDTFSLALENVILSYQQNSIIHLQVG